MERTQAARVAASRDFPGSPVFDRRCLSLLFSTAPLLTSKGTPSLNAVQRGGTDKKGPRKVGGCGQSRSRSGDLPARTEGHRLCPVDAQTCFTTSEAGKRTFFWDAYLSSSAR